MTGTVVRVAALADLHCTKASQGAFQPLFTRVSEAADIALPAAPDMALVRAALDGAAIDAIATPAEGRRKALLVADMERLSETAYVDQVEVAKIEVTRDRCYNLRIIFVDIWELQRWQKVSR
jgi:hypothetical protein